MVPGKADPAAAVNSPQIGPVFTPLLWMVTLTEFEPPVSRKEIPVT